MFNIVYVFFIAVFVVTVITAIAIQQSSSLNVTLGQLATRYEGFLTEGGLASLPSVRFPYRDARVILDYFSTGGKNKTTYTQIKMYGQIPRVRCEIYPEGFWTSVGRLIGIEDIQVGSAKFDADYVIKGENSNIVRALLNPRVQASIDSLRRLVGNGDIYVSISHGVLHVRKRSKIRDLQTLEQLAQRTLQLYDMLTSTSDEGIEFVTQADVEIALATAICQVCGEAIRTDVVFCRKCDTAHHRECWQYYGACSTYGCREKNFRLPGK